MKIPAHQVLITTFLVFFALSVSAGESQLGDYQRISSQYLGYDLQYRVYTPANSNGDSELASLYVTDGESYLALGNFKSVLDEAISSGQIRPVLVVFLDSRNPDNLQDSRRHSQFMCNVEFAKFFAGELIPTIGKTQPVSLLREDRTILGVSFGAINSACFGLMLSDLFSGIAMQSPGSGDHVDVVRGLYEERDRLPLKMYLSAGTDNDNLREASRFRRALEDKGYELTFTKVRRGGHDWDNWAPLLDDILITFYGTEK